MTSVKKVQGKYSRKEIVESFVLPQRLTASQKKDAALNLKQARTTARAEMTEEQILSSKVLQLKFQLEDYLRKEEFNPEFKFGHFLSAYVTLQNKKRREFAREIHINETELSQLINHHRSPNDNLIIRLEIHSNNFIPAVAWYKLVQKEKEYEIMTNKVMRQQEMKFVTNKLPVSAANKPLR
jgi:plasmid maintenance system antidote protein VapI